MKNPLYQSVLASALLLLTPPIFASSSSYIVGADSSSFVSANYWSGSSSRNWYGGGVATVLAGWKAEKNAASTPNPTATAAPTAAPKIETIKTNDAEY